MDFPLVPVQLGKIYACLLFSAIHSFRFSTGWLKSAVFYLLAPHCLVDNPPRWAKAYPYGGLAPTNHLIANKNDQNSDKSVTPAGEYLQKSSQFAQQAFSTGSTAQQTGSTAQQTGSAAQQTGSAAQQSDFIMILHKKDALHGILFNLF